MVNTIYNNKTDSQGRVGKRLLTPEERAIAAEQRVEKLAEKLRSLGRDPDALT